jgi:SPP1 family predicted phage head-tail adaptor
VKERTRAGRMRDRVSFQSEERTSDGGGGFTINWVTVVTVWGQLVLETGREKLQADRLESAVAGTLTVRSSTETLAITAGMRAVIDGVSYQIRSISNRDRRDDYLEMVVEQGVAI